MREWLDATFYKHNQKHRDPKRFVVALDSLEIVVHRSPYYPPDMWLLTTYPEIFSQHPLNSSDVAVAKEEALKLVREHLESMLKQMDA